MQMNWGYFPFSNKPNVLSLIVRTATWNIHPQNLKRMCLMSIDRILNYKVTKRKLCSEKMHWSRIGKPAQSAWSTFTFLPKPVRINDAMNLTESVASTQLVTHFVAEITVGNIRVTSPWRPGYHTIHMTAQTCVVVLQFPSCCPSLLFRK